jgi:hypothetical protein
VRRNRREGEISAIRNLVGHEGKVGVVGFRARGGQHGVHLAPVMRLVVEEMDDAEAIGFDISRPAP